MWIKMEVDITDLIRHYRDSLNPICQNLLTISQFDFSSDLDLNTLEHIFEQYRRPRRT